MEKRNYTQVQALLPGIRAMPAGGKTQPEVAEHYGFQDRLNSKWATDISCLHTKQGVLYRPYSVISMITALWFKRLERRR